ncbi:hypothetical protein H112_05721 [Trichophyton rubrum D6]|nr:uncharacterized protein TERG_03438 [Trichophyton rubrum CBS 118892]EZF16276.1 hypothetical protein H100_05738 [Trichophyton rubrum MR850]EZF40412.1 hypothetical protein H102_05706 [Trichophyton rubrum CBS 100081]EZF50920.1 hypothetical protein H103_05734 [Trichophyton rubrum CBS 288.86]EZF61635.1 hypothetical protein H104_05718 [Trichophyton rubrum CBS 289.86]EZF83057.1 hypothetical protein H110_05728 [Trichophyton rubrum MR1448]EZF93604.1 hypothetical protein H113_05775 [Trichophyton rubr
MHSPDTHQESSEKKGFTTADTTPAHTPLETSRRNSECYQREGDSVSDEKDQVDGGLRAWLVLLGAWLCFANSWGITSVFGVFQSYYLETGILGPSYSASSISWIGSIQAFLTMFAGVFSGHLMDTGYTQQVLFVGTGLIVLGTALLSVCKEYYQVLLTQGICVGIGSGMLLLVSLAMLSMWFKKKKMLAAGVASTGSAITAFYVPIALGKLFATIGFAWTVRVYALIILLTAGTACLVMTPKKVAFKHGPLINVNYFKDPKFTLFVIAFGFTMAANYIPYFYLTAYAKALNVKSGTLGLVSIINAVSAVSRLPPALLAHYIGGANTLIICCGLSTVTLYLYTLTTSTFGGLVALAACYALASGGVLFLPPMILSNFAGNDRAQYGTMIGMGYTIGAIGVLVGNPIAGATISGSATNTAAGEIGDIGKAHSKYLGVWIVAGSSMAIATALHFSARMIWVNWKIKSRV